MHTETLHTDLLIVGTGFAGLWAGIAARERGVDRILYVDKGAIGTQSQSHASAGSTIFALPGDDIEGWLDDIALANEGLSRRPYVRHLLQTCDRRLRRLERLGVQYPTFLDGYMRVPSTGLGRPAMLVAPRLGERTGGAAVMHALRHQALRGAAARPGVTITRLVVRDGRVVGAAGIDRRTGGPVTIAARAVVIATADCNFEAPGSAHRRATGDGFALAYAAGARLSNMAFLYAHVAPRALGPGDALEWGGGLVDDAGRPLMHVSYPGDPPLQTAPASMAMPTPYGPPRWGARVRVMHGGILTDMRGRTDVPGLFGAGTAAALDPGLFNGWSTFRAMGTGELAGHGAAEWLKAAPAAAVPDAELRAAADAVLAPTRRDASEDPVAIMRDLRATVLSPDICVRKCPAALERALNAVRALRARADRAGARDAAGLIAVHEAAHMVTVGEIFLWASITRAESRSAHQRIDHPDRDPAGPYWLDIAHQDGRVGIDRVPVDPQTPRAVLPWPTGGALGARVA